MPDQMPTRWMPDRTPRMPPWPMPPTATAMARGAINRCPACGNGKLFVGFLTVAPVCPVCTAPLGEFRADDAPPYFTILIVAHVIVPLMFLMDRDEASLWLEAAIFIPATVLLALLLIRPVKGATVGLMLRLNMLRPAE
jgi:uncharacterized protein (DUF983 family)